MKKIFIVLLTVILFFAFVSCSSNADNKTNNTNQTTSKYTTYNLGEIGKSGYYQLKTVSYSETNSIKGINETYTTSNKFIIVNIEIAANDLAVTDGYSPTEFMLCDSDGRTYAAHDATNDINIINKHTKSNYIEIFEALNPGIFKKTQLVFEIQKDAIPYMIANQNDESAGWVQYLLK